MMSSLPAPRWLKPRGRWSRQERRRSSASRSDAPSFRTLPREARGHGRAGRDQRLRADRAECAARRDDGQRDEPRVRGGERHHRYENAGAPPDIRLGPRALPRQRRRQGRRASRERARDQSVRHQRAREAAVERPGCRAGAREHGSVHRRSTSPPARRRS
jgi:hypothetical protein